MTLPALDTSTTRYTLAFDLGSSTFKSVLVSDDAAQGAMLLHRMPAPTPQRAGAAREFDPAELLTAIANLLDSSATAIRERKLRLRCIAVTGAIGSALLANETGVLQSPCLSLSDQRCVDEAEAMASSFADDWPTLLGHDLPMHTCWGLPKFRYLSAGRHREALMLAAKVLQLADLLALQLTNHALSHPTAWIGLVNQQHRQPVTSLFNWAGLRSDQLPAFRSAPLTAAMARRFGQPGPVPVMPAGGDMFAGFHGFALEPGQACLIAGTTEIIGLCHETPGKQSPTPSGLIRLQLDAHRSITYGSTNHGGASMRWLAQLLGITLADLPELVAQASQLPTVRQPDDALLFIPHIGGARAPHWQARMTGGFVGLQPHHTPAHLARAVLEGCALAKRSVLHAIIENIGQQPELVMAAGGGGDPFTHQLRADILHLPIHAMPDADVTALGAALQAMGHESARWSSQYRDLHPPTVFNPSSDRDRQAFYQQLFTRFHRVESVLLAEHSQGASIQMSTP